MEMNDRTRISTGKPTHKRRFGWKTELSKIISAHNDRAANRDKTVGDATRAKRIEVLYLAFNDIRQLGCKIENPRNLQERHVRMLARHWESQGLASSTIQNRISILRVFAEWIGKHNMIKDSHLYVSQPQSVARDQVAREDKGWQARDIDFEEVWAKLYEYDERVGVQVLLIKEFGLRRQEAVMFRPYVAERLGDRSNDIVVEFGTKGGRPRSVPVETEGQKRAMELAKKIAVTHNGHVGWNTLTLAQAVKRYSNVLARFGITKKEMGVTGHGLRHDYANDKYERMTGKPTPVRGGVKGEVETEADYVARMQTSQALGHSRLSITPSYCGSFKPKKAAKGTQGAEE